MQLISNIHVDLLYAQDNIRR